MSRFALAAVLIPAAFAQNFPAFRWVHQVNPSGLANFGGIVADAQGNTYIAATRCAEGSHECAEIDGQGNVVSEPDSDVFVTKLDSSGNVVYSTRVGGSAADAATAMAVDAGGAVYVAGVTSSPDFPTTAGVFAPSVQLVKPPTASFLFKLNPDGSVAYSTYFTASGTTPHAIAVDSSGAVYLAGTTSGTLPTTAGAYQPHFSGNFPCLFFCITTNAFLTKFDAAGSKLIFSTYVNDEVGNALALAPDGSAYVAGGTGIFHVSADGSALLGSAQPFIRPRALALAPDGSVYLAGEPGTNSAAQPFAATPGAFQMQASALPQLPTQGASGAFAVAKLDGQLQNVLAATYFGGSYGATANAIALDAFGDLLIGGATAGRGLPLRDPIQAGFAPGTGFLAELSGDLSTLLFSSYFGDAEDFSVQGVAVAPDGSVVIVGGTGQGEPANSGPFNVWANSLTLPAPPALRIDTVENAASMLDGPVSAGETVVVQGAGFGDDAQVSIGGAAAAVISRNASAITAVVPSDIPPGSAEVEVQSGGAASNQVLVPVALASPGLFSADGSGYGQGYILNSDGSLNTPSHPANPGDRITIFATGVGPLSFVQGFAVTAFPPEVFVDGFYADGVAAVSGPVQGFPGNVYQLTVYVPDPSKLVANNPNLQDFTFPPQVGVVLKMNGAASQNGLAISIAP